MSLRKDSAPSNYLVLPPPLPGYWIYSNSLGQIGPQASESKSFVLNIIQLRQDLWAIFPGSALSQPKIDITWHHLGTPCMGNFCAPLGPTLSQLWESFEIILILFWGKFRTILWQLWDNFGQLWYNYLILPLGSTWPFFTVNFVKILVLGLGKEVPLWIGRLGKFAKRSDLLHSESNEQQSYSSEATSHQVLKARKRGILFDLGHGQVIEEREGSGVDRFSFSFRKCEFQHK